MTAQTQWTPRYEPDRAHIRHFAAPRGSGTKVRYQPVTCRPREHTRRPRRRADMYQPPSHPEGENMIKSKKLLAVGIIAALGLAACGSDDDASSSSEAPAGTEATEGTEAPAAPRPPPAPTLRPRATAPSAWCSTSPVVATSRSTTPPAPASTRPRPNSVSTASESDPDRRRGPCRAPAGSRRRGRQPVIGVGFLFGDAITEAVGQQPRHDLRHRRLGRRSGQRGIARVRRGTGLVPRRRRRGAQVHVRQDRLHRWRRDRPHQEVRGRLHRRC